MVRINTVYNRRYITVNYHKIYDSLIDRARTRTIDGHRELHHVVPRCMGGDNEPDNIVALTPEEHFFAHVVLVKLYPTNRKLIFALNRMSGGHQGKRSRKIYGWLKRRFVQAIGDTQTGANNSQFGKRWITDGLNNKFIRRGDEVPSGWRPGRFIPCKQQVLPVCMCCGARVETMLQKYCSLHREARRAPSRVKGPQSYTNRVFITNGNIDKLHPRDQPIPDGWARGRSTNKPR